jgi:hypothetical protein
MGWTRTGPLPVIRNTAPVTHFLTAHFVTVTGETTRVTGEVPVSKTACISRKVCLERQ